MNGNTIHPQAARTCTVVQYIIVLLCLMLTATTQAGNDWSGEWKSNDRNLYQSFSITNIQSDEFELEYDEGIGINGVAFSARGKFTAQDSATVEYTDRAEQQCTLNMKFSIDSGKKRITTTQCALSQFNESTYYTFVPENEKLFYTASFNCAKAGNATELKICDTRKLAEADRQLGERYTTLRKALNNDGKKQLKASQRRWLKNRNSQCSRLDGDTLEFCLREHYGLRLVQLFLLQKYGINPSGPPGYEMYSAIIQSSEKNNQQLPDLLSQGIDLWLDSKTARRLTDSGDYEVETEINDKLVVISGGYAADPRQGFDPASYGNAIIIVFTKDGQTWLGLKHSEKALMYIPRGKSMDFAPQAVYEWLRQSEMVYSVIRNTDRIEVKEIF